ncbi:hypothetical protein VCUG_02510 [Vavraia culicis subsp. floridensis]|uniref:Uncharacterized protein n=1 Tax=Vavraia culicis (isolate floridensis) TaxID=948595 RepID=L2GQV4_VAVCU|nr:uncharacterized protein VCUG_02510 [Vavraia culicis subsp. floridensis]ELA45999.1 hypothetical protein VCUG_02510 [Vavraia culicis subsp. floridensis]
MINVLLYLLTNYAAYQDIMAPDIPCTSDNKTYSIDLKIHAEESVIRAIHSVALSNIVAHETEREAVSGYFGTIIDEMNDHLMQYKVQLHLKLDAYNTDEFMATISVDPSCEKTSPVIERTSAAFDFLNESFAGNIGCHLFIWGCNYIPPRAELKTIFNSLRCGRVAGLLWRGMDETRELIKNTILDSLVGLEHLYAPSPSEEVNLAGKLCRYVQQCVGMQSSEIGQLIQGSAPVRYTDSESGVTPGEEGALISYNAVAH